MRALSSSRLVAASFVFALQTACAGGDSQHGTAPASDRADATTASGGTPSLSTGGTPSLSTGGAPIDTGSGGSSIRSGSGGSPGLPPGGASSTSSGGTGATGGAPAANGGTTALSPRLFYLDIGGGRVLSSKPDGTDVRVLVSGASSLPDGVAVDVATGHVFWTNMGLPDANDGFVDRADLNGQGITAPVAAGKTFTPKQLKLDTANGKLYWADREGMRIQRANLDGTQLETLVETGSGDAARRDAANWCVGIALDVPGKKIYWTQKGGDNAGVGSIRRAGLEVPSGETPANRTDVEVLFDHLPEPIDLDVDLGARLLYWTDRGNPPRGNTVSRAPMDPPAAGAASRTDQQILVTGLAEGIGIALDPAHGAMYFTDLGGTIYVANLDGTAKKKVLGGQGSLTGIAYVELPP